MRLQDVPRYYDRAAERYDRRLDLWFGKVLRLGPLRERAVEALGDVRGATVLDVGCGTGANLSLLVERVGPGGRIIGVDYSEGMLSKARQKVERYGWETVSLRRGDAAELGVVSEPVDAVLSTYCLGIVHDLPRALARILDLLVPGGRLAVLDFHKTRPDRGALRLLSPLYRCYLRWAGIDAPEDLDDARLRERWARGKGTLRESLRDFHERTFLQDMGILLTGTKP